MGKLARRGLMLAVVIGVLGVGSYAIAGGGSKTFKGSPLNGYEENPDISTVGTGSFEARLSDDGTSLHYKLSYSGLEGNVLQSHVHFGKRAVNGGISVFLCSNLTGDSAPPPGTAACPQSGTVSGVLEPADIIGPVPQGIEAMAFEELVKALKGGHTYANVHSSKWPGGEIRAQIKKDNGDDD
jgi:hypothetical protein